MAGAEHEELAKTAHLDFDYPAAIDAYERAYFDYQGEGDLLAGARCARTIGWFRGSLYGEWAVYNGWAARAGSLLDQAGDRGSAPGWRLLGRAQRGGDLDTQRGEYLEAITIARRTGDRDLECDALASIGIMLLFSGLRADGLRYLDEALTVVCAGEVAELAVVEGVMCGLFNACERTRDVGRATQWLRAADDIVRRRGMAAVGGYCRAYYGGILTAAGRWSEAEVELQAALQTFAPEHRAVRGGVLTRLAGLRLRQGRLEEAAQLLVGQEDRLEAANTLALLHLAAGRPEHAVELVDRTLSGGSIEDAVEGPLLATLTEALLSLGDGTRAQQVAGRLAQLAQDQTGPYLPALAAFTRARVCRGTGSADPQPYLQSALTGFATAELPVEAALVRLELAYSLADSQPVVAADQARAARIAFEEFGAQREADAAAALLRTLGHPTRGRAEGGELTARETEVLRLLGHGLSNNEIAERLVISPKTVEHHVSRVLRKLGLRSRGQAAAYASQRARPPVGR